MVYLPYVSILNTEYLSTAENGKNETYSQRLRAFLSSAERRPPNIKFQAERSLQIARRDEMQSDTRLWGERWPEIRGDALLTVRLKGSGMG